MRSRKTNTSLLYLGAFDLLQILGQSAKNYDFYMKLVIEKGKKYILITEQMSGENDRSCSGPALKKKGRKGERKVKGLITNSSNQ